MEYELRGTLYENFFEVFNKYMESVKKDMHASGAALIIMKDDKIVHEWYSGNHHFGQGAKRVNRNSRFNVYSVRVTYVALAIAIAIDEGLLDLDDRLSDYLYEYEKSILGDTTIRHLLTRCTGLKFENGSVSRAFELGTDIEGKNPEILAKILYQATGKTVNDILTDRVFHPLNWRNSGWVTEGVDQLVCDIDLSKNYPSLRIGSNIGDERNLYVSARDLAFWGNLHLNKGEVDGRQILPKEVFELTTSNHSPNTLPNHLPMFGFLWRIQGGEVLVDYNELGSELPDGTFQILGASGCSCTVIPKYNAVAVRMFNSLNSYENLGFDYLKDIQMFGNRIVSWIKHL